MVDNVAYIIFKLGWGFSMLRNVLIDFGEHKEDGYCSLLQIW